MSYTTLGYIASCFVILSLMMSNIKYLRWVNLVGASTFATYGFLIKAYPVFLMNIVIIMVDIYYLIRIYTRQDFFAFNDSFKGNEFFFKRFLAYYEEDIRKFFPDFDFSKIKDPKIILISRNINPVGFFIYEKLPDNRILIHLDYVRPEYRDLKNFDYLIKNKSEFFKDCQDLITYSNVKTHQKYLEKVGFEKDITSKGRFVKKSCG